MKISLVAEAVQDLASGWRFYENREAGLGDYFLDSLFSDIDSLQFFGGIHGKKFGYHRLLARRFPFAIYYRVENQAVRVCAVLDCRQDPSWIRKRLT